MIYFFLAALIIFLARFIFMWTGAKKEKSRNYHYDIKDYPFVSVIVPSRNEENNIPNCLESLVNSDYPKDKYEIIAVNDRSSDNTEKIIREFAKRFPNIKPVNVKQDNSERNLKGKPGALQAGIDEAKGKYLMMTDADCIVNPEWIKKTALTMEAGNLDLMPSFTLISGKKLFDKIQANEWIYMHTMASAGVGHNTPLGCYGNNLTIKRNKYEELGGYSNIDFSVTEDLALEKAVFNSGGNVHYHCDKATTVTTLPVTGISEYLKQKKRWAVGGTALGWKALYFVISSVLIWLSVFASIFFQDWLWLTAFLLVRIISDYILIESSLKKLRLKNTRIYAIPSIIFFMIMELMVPFTLLTGKVKWKGQKF